MRRFRAGAGAFRLAGRDRAVPAGAAVAVGRTDTAGPLFLRLDRQSRPPLTPAAPRLAGSPTGGELHVGLFGPAVGTHLVGGAQEQLTASIAGAVMSYVLVPQERTTRLLLKIVLPRGRIVAPLVSVGDLVMARRQLLNLKRLAEQSGRTSPYSPGASGPEHDRPGGECAGGAGRGCRETSRRPGIGNGVRGDRVHLATSRTVDGRPHGLAGRGRPAGHGGTLGTPDRDDDVTVRGHVRRRGRIRGAGDLRRLGLGRGDGSGRVGS